MSVQVQDYFDVKYGVNLELVDLERADDGINFVSRTAENNGVSARVKPIENKKPNPKNTISVSCGGSVMESFLQKEEYYSGRDIYILIPKLNFSDRQLLYFCMCLQANKYRYNYGRQPNKTLKQINIPSIDDIPRWVEEINFPTIPSKKPLSNMQYKFNPSNWTYFELGKIFKISLGKPIHKVDIKDLNIGKTPYVTRTTENNGVELFLNVPNNKKDFITKENVITIGAEGFKAFYQNKPFITGNKVNILSSNFLNKFNAFFIIQILNLEISKKFNYGRGAVKNRLEVLRIKLPADKENNPDWTFMENYVKSLSYSTSI